ncbi:MAG TPA: hypothetical protein PKX48_02870 [Planctomycetota bacterium]|jgi:hypothetical protein|nr:hypothetical protein [Planctomycetota bacterium]OQC20742.1 MAG: hypothetical protein BWX69_01581 [Planctomycetes bacterium ADurb.Bin069]NMD36931.1 hypothetical protein [Planctomycetota bacterium]HNR98352.1 hypothetical protein [Planctomycetota bacterium]HNU26747.1 hypothetical protein [Planctomycetota bacterium]
MHRNVLLAGVAIVASGLALFLLVRVQRCDHETPRTPPDEFVRVEELPRRPPDENRHTETHGSEAAPALITVYDFFTKDPISSELTSADQVIRTSPAGDAVLMLLQPPHEVIAKADGYVPGRFMLPDEIREARLPLVPADPHRVFVTDTDSHDPVVHAQVRLWLDGAVIAEARTDEGGRAMVSRGEIFCDLRAGETGDVALRRLRWNRETTAMGYMPDEELETVVSFGTREGDALVELEPVWTLQGLVIDPNGRPMPDAHVLWTWNLVKGLGSVFRDGEAVTDSQGHFTWEGPRTTQQTMVLACHPQYGYTWQQVRYPFTHSETGLVLRLNDACSLEGTVTQNDNLPLAQAMIMLEPLDHPNLRRSAVRCILRSSALRSFSESTGQEGRFLFRGLPPGRYRVVCMHPGLVLDMETPITVTLPYAGPVTIRMRPGGMRIRGLVLSTEGDPIPGAIVDVMRRNVNSGTPAFFKLPVHVDGSFELSDLEDGPYLVGASAIGFSGDPVEVKPGNTDDVLVVLARTTGPDPTPGEEVSLPIRIDYQGALPTLQFLEIAVCSASHTCRLVAVRVERGSAELRLAPGTWDIVTSAYGFAPEVIRGVTVPAPEPLSVTLRPAPTWAGRIEAEGPETPDLLAVIDRDGRRLRQVALGPDGDFLIHGLPPGLHTFRAWTNLGRQWRGEVNLERGCEDEVVVTLKRADN